MRSRSHLTLSVVVAALCIALAGSATAQIVPDYIMTSRCQSTYDEDRPVNNDTWQTGFAFVHIRDSVTGSGGWTGRHTFDYTAYAYRNGANGIAEYGTGDDICLGELKSLPGNGIIDWSVAATAPDAASGTFSLTDSPNGDYTNSTGTATIDQSINLSGASSAELLFFHHHALRWTSSSDRGYIEVSTNGGASWIIVDPDFTPAVNYYRYYYGDNHQFKRGSANLQAFIGQPNVQIRFRYNWNNGSHDDGWFIDDVHVIVDDVAQFADDFESGTGQWSLTGGWNTSNAAYSYQASLGSIDQNGTYTVTPIVAPVTTGEGMGYNAIQVSYTIMGQTRDAYAKLYHTAPQFVQPPDFGEEDLCEATVAVGDALAPVHARLDLEQNTPNPFNPTTRITFRLADEGRATLRVYDESGRLVRTLLEAAPIDAGEHVFEWDGRDARGALQSSGVYLYKLEARGETVSRKMVMVR